MALAGHDTPILVFNDTSTTTTYSGSITVAAGELVDVILIADGNSNAQDPSTWTVTLGGVAMNHVASTTTSLTEAFSAYFSLETASSGSVTLSVTTVNATRGMAANAFRITGHNTTTPHPNSGSSQPGSNLTSLTSPNAVSTSANGNAIIGGVGVHGGDITGLAVAAADGSSTGKTGTNAFNDVTWGVAWDETPTAAAVTFAWSWTGSDRPTAVWAEVAAAAGSLTVDAPTGTYSLTGFAPSISRSLAISAPTGAYALSGFAPSVTASLIVAAPAGSYTLNGLAPALTRALNIAATGGSYSLTGYAPSIATAGAISVPAGSYAFTGYAPVIHVPTGSDATWGGAWATWGSLGATWTVSATIDAPAGSYSLSGFAPTLSVGLRVAAPVGAYTVSGFAPTLTRALAVSPPAGALTLTGFAPSISTAGVIGAPVGSYSLSGHAPTLARSLRLSAPAGIYVLTGSAPTTVRSIVMPVPTGTYTFTGFAPSLTVAGLINFITIASVTPPRSVAVGGGGSARAIGGGGA